MKKDTPPVFNEKDARRFYRWLDHHHDEYTEIRIISWPPTGLVIQRWVQNEDDFIQLCRKWSGKRQVYAGVNPRFHKGGANEDVARVIAIPLDIDSFRPSKDVAATEAELAAAKERMIEINSWIQIQGYQPPFIAMSGNGYHLLQRVNIPTTENLSTEDLSSKIESYFFNEVPGSDKMDKILDASRILKVPGTLSVKGHHTEERPHRLSYIVNEGNPNADKTLGAHINELEPYVPTHEIYMPTPTTTPEAKIKRRTSSLKPCFKRFAEEGGKLSDDGKEDNELRMALVSEAHSKGYSRKQIIELFSKSNDFGDGKITTYNVDRLLGKIVAKGLIVWSCKAIYKHGGCLGETCKRYKKHVAKHLPKQPAPPTLKSETPFLKVIAVVNGEPVYGVNQGAVLDYFKETLIYKTPRDTEQLYLYDNGLYQLGKTYIKGELENMLGNYNSKALTSEILAHLVRGSYCEREDFNRFEGEIPVLNGLLNLETMQLEAFDPEKIFTFKVNTKFDSSKDCPKFKAALKQILPKADERALTQEFSGYTLLPEFPYHDFMIFIGGGRNGKGVIIRTLEGILGKENVSNVRLEYFGSRHKFIIANIYGKLMNVCSEPSIRYPFKTEMLKQITGQDTLSGSIKFIQNLLSFVPFAKFFIQANKLPQVDDITLSFWDRVNIIEFTQTFTATKGNRIPYIERTWLNDEDERSGILNWMITGLKRLKENNGFTQTESKEQQILTFKRVSDPIGAFLTDPEECMYGSILWVTHNGIYEAYKNYSEAQGTAIESIGVLKGRIRKLPGVLDRKKKIARKDVRIWKGISKREKTPSLDDLDPEEEKPKTEAHEAPILHPSQLGGKKKRGKTAASSVSCASETDIFHDAIAILKRNNGRMQQKDLFQILIDLEYPYLTSDLALRGDPRFIFMGMDIRLGTQLEEETMTMGQIDINKTYAGKQKSLQVQLQKVLGVISEMERITGVVKDEDLFDELMSDHGIGQSEVARLIGTLSRDGTIYSPRHGYYKRTRG